MPSTTSGTNNFSMDVDDIVRQAMIPLGGEHTSGISSADARLTLSLLLITLSNKNIPIHKLDETTLPLVGGVAEYTLNTNIEDVLELTIEQYGTETTLNRYGVREFHNIPVKTMQQRPSVS